MGIYDSGSGSPVDYQLEQAKLDRQRLVAQGMIQKGLTPAQGQMVSGHYVGPGWGGALAQLASGFAGHQMQKGLDEKAQNLGEQYNKGLSAAMNKYMDTQQGTPASGGTKVADVENLMRNDVDLPESAPRVEAVPGNRRKAAIDALTSQYKPLQAIGNNDMQYLTKTDPFQKLVEASIGAGGQGGQGQSAAAPGAVQGPNASPMASGGQGTSGDPMDVALKRIAPAVDSQTARLLMASDPTGAKLAEANRLAMMPQQGRGFGTERLNTQTGRMELISDPVALNGQIAAAKLNVGNQGELTSFTNAQGEVINLSKAQLLQLTGQGPAAHGGAPAPLPQQGLPPQPQPQPQPPQQQGGLPVPLPAGPSGDPFQPAGQPPLGARGALPLPSAPVHAGNGGAQMPTGGNVPTMPNGANAGHPTAPQAPAVGFRSGQTPELLKEQQGVGDMHADSRKKLEEAAGAAMTIKARVASMRTDSQNFTGGSLTDLKMSLGGLLIAAGADTEQVTKRLGSVADMQGFNKEAMSLAFDQVRTLGSREALGVVEMALKANASLTTQPDATAKIMNMVEGLADFTLAKQQAEHAWADRNGTVKGFNSHWNATEPITKYVDLASLRETAPKGAKPAGQQVMIHPGAKQPAPVISSTPMTLDAYLKSRGQ